MLKGLSDVDSLHRLLHHLLGQCWANVSRQLMWNCFESPVSSAHLAVLAGISRPRRPARPSPSCRRWATLTRRIRRRTRQSFHGLGANAEVERDPSLPVRCSIPAGLSCGASGWALSRDDITVETGLGCPKEDRKSADYHHRPPWPSVAFSGLQCGRRVVPVANWVMYCLQWLIPVLLIPKPVNPAFLYNHAVLMILYLAGFFLERKPCTVCSLAFVAVIVLISNSDYGQKFFWYDAAVASASNPDEHALY